VLKKEFAVRSNEKAKAEKTLFSISIWLIFKL
jgi:hypothetical protein